MKLRSAYWICIGVLALLALLALCGCTGRAKPRLVLPEQPDAYDLWAQSLQQEDSFYAELQRLQRLYTAAPDLALAGSPRNYDGQYTIASRIEAQRAGLELTDRNTGEHWTLWFLDYTAAGDKSIPNMLPPRAPNAPPAGTPGVEAQNIEAIRDEATAGGYAIELALGGGKLTLSVTARWVQGRYLQCTRELTLGGLDQTTQADAACTAWTLDGAWLPYRLAPGLAGPYGVVPDAEADGDWREQTYPVEAMVPAVAAYSRTRGFLLAVSDDHPRKLDRRYGLGYVIPPGRLAGEQIRLGYTAYDGTRDTFSQPWLVSGLPARDSVVLEPFTLSWHNIDSTLVEAESFEVIGHIGGFVHAYHFMPKPPTTWRFGGVVREEQVVSLAKALGQEQAAAVAQAAGPCGVKLCLLNPFNFDVKPGTSTLPIGGVGIDASGIAESSELAEAQLARFDELSQSGLQPIVQVNLGEIPYSHSTDYAGLPGVMPEWFIDNTGWVLAECLDSLKQGNDSGWPELVQPNWRVPQASAWYLRKLAEDLPRYYAIAGYSFNFAPPVESGAHPPPAPLTVSMDAYNAVIQLHLREAIQAKREGVVLLTDTLPSLGIPVWGDVLLRSETASDRFGGSSRKLAPSLASRRMSAFLLQDVFYARLYLGVGHDMQHLKLADTVLDQIGTINGRLLDPTPDAGFATFATHQLELAASAGELRVIHSFPEKNSYTGGDERPAECEELIAILPGDWAGAHAIWVAFHGIGGKLSVDNYNNLTVDWGGGRWTGKLPTGYWVVEHPSQGTQIAPGDAVLLQLRPIAPGSSPERPLG